MFRKVVLTIGLLAGAFDVLYAQSSEMGLWLDAGVTKKFGKRWSVDAEAEYRMNDNMGKTDRVGLGVGTSYRITKWLKASAGYQFLYNYKASELGSGGKKQYDSYWYARHRVNVDLTGALKVDRWRFSLRERWVYTYRPEVTVTGSKLSSGATVSKIREGGGENVLRSRLQVEYDIRKCPVTPYTSVEAYNNWDLQKMRYSIGGAYEINKHHELKLYYMYQDRKHADTDDDVLDTHVLGLSYNYSF